VDEFPWSKQEIIAAVVAEYMPLDQEDIATRPFFTLIRALQRLALRSRKGPPGFGENLDTRKATPLEDAVYARLARVWQALYEGRDPDAAYEVPLRGQMH
jgi:hypothetical protein